MRYWPMSDSIQNGESAEEEKFGTANNAKRKQNDPTVTSDLVSIITTTSQCLRSQTMPIILIDM
jgi:hypothetical protein